MVLTHLRDRFTPATETARQTIGIKNRQVSKQTIINRLRSAGLRSRHPRKVPVLTPRHRRERLTWARRYLSNTRADWANVLFVDEVLVNLRANDGLKRIYRRRGERNSENCLVQHDRFGGGSIMVWGGISQHTKTPLVHIQGNLNAQRYQNEVIRPVLVPRIQANRCMRLAQDNAPCHTARTTRNMLATNNIVSIPWPAKSPDLNPIEHVWDILKRRIRQFPNQRNLRDLARVVTITWANLNQQDFRNQIVSMRSRCLAVIRAGGGHTRY